MAGVGVVVETVIGIVVSDVSGDSVAVTGVVCLVVVIAVAAAVVVVVAVAVVVVVVVVVVLSA